MNYAADNARALVIVAIGFALIVAHYAIFKTRPVEQEPVYIQQGSAVR